GLEGFRVFTSQHLHMCVDHPVECGGAGIAQAMNRLVGRRAELPVLLSPGVVCESDAGSQQLGARVQQWIAQGGAEADGLLDGRDTPIWIENGKRTDQAPECVDLRGYWSSVGGPRRCFVSFGALDPRP